MIITRAELIADIVNLVVFIIFGFFVVLLICPCIAWDVYGETPYISKGCNGVTIALRKIS